MKHLNFLLSSTFFRFLFLSRQATTYVWLTQYTVLVVATTVVGWLGWTAPGFLVWGVTMTTPAVYWWMTARGVTPGIAAWWLSLVAGSTLGATAMGADWEHGRLGTGLLLDGINLPYVLLTATLTPLVVLASIDSIRKNQRAYYAWVLLLFGLLTLVFCVEDFLTFYVLFEVLGFPMFLLIGQYGPRLQRVTAAYKFFVYTF